MDTTRTRAKYCPKCKTERDISEFHKSKIRYDGLQSECKACKLNRERVYKNTDAGKLRSRKYAQSEKGKAARKRGYAKHGYVHQNKRGLFRRVLAIYKKCQLCPNSVDLTLDHMHPVSRGGTDDLTNLWILCYSCNSFKGARLMTPGGALLCN